MTWKPNFAWASLLFVMGAAAPSGYGQNEAASQDEAAFQQAFTQAQEAQRHGDYQRAVALYQEALKVQSDVAEVHANLGLAQHLSADYGAAVKSFENALRLNPRLAAPNLFLGLDLLKLQQPKRALPYLQHAQRLAPRDGQALMALAQAYGAVREFEKSNQWYVRAAAALPSSADAWHGVGVTHLILGQAALDKLSRAAPNSLYVRLLLAESREEQDKAAEAVSLYRQVLGLGRPPDGTHAALGLVLHRQNDLPAAETEFKAELEQTPGCLLARLGLARLDYERGDFAAGLGTTAAVWKTDAVFVQIHAPLLWRGFREDRLAQIESHLRQASNGGADASAAKDLLAALDTWRGRPLDDLAVLYAATNRVRRKAPARNAGDAARLYAEGRYGDCAAAAERSPAAEQLLARCAFQTGDYQASFEAAGRILAAAPLDREALYWRTRASQKLAVVALMRAGLAEPDSHRVHLILGQTYMQKQDYAAAVAEYAQALKLRPDYTGARLGLAVAYFKEYRFDESAAELRTLLQYAPKDPDGSYLMADILVESREFEKALPYLKDALNGRPSSLPSVHEMLGKVYRGLGDDRRAIAELEQARPADHNGKVHYQLFQLYKKVGAEKEAAAALSRSKELWDQRLAAETDYFRLLSPE